MVKRMKKYLLCLLALLAVIPCSAKDISYDIVVAGAGCGGYCAAVQAARQGCNVLLLEESDYLGGQMAAAGVGTMDEGTPRIRENGIYKEFCSRVSKHYSSLGLINNICYFATNSFAVEPHVAQKVIYEMISDANKLGKGRIDLWLLSTVTKVHKDGNKVIGVNIETGLKKKVTKKVSCKILIDATEYGDVIPLTGAPYLIAKHTNKTIDRQSLMQMNTWTAIVKEYSGGVPEFLKVKTKTSTYDKNRWRFENIHRYAADGYNIYKKPASWNSVAYFRGMPDSNRPGVQDYTVKTELNIGQIDISMQVNDCINPIARLSKEMALRIRTLEFIYYMQNELGLQWSVDPAEGYDTPYNRAQIDRIIALNPELEKYKAILYYFPVYPYVRESYRIIGQHILTSGEIDRVKGAVHFADALSLNDYPEDLHGSRRPQDMDVDIDSCALEISQAKRDWGATTGEFQVPMRSFIPKTLDGFLVAEKNLSQSRLVNGATRLQPSTMNNGQAAGNIAALCVKYNCQPRQLSAILVQWEQVKAKSPVWFQQIGDIAVETDLWGYAQLALVKGYFTLGEFGRFYPYRLVNSEQLSTLINKCGLAGIVSPDAQITRADLIKIIIDRELEEAAKL